MININLLPWREAIQKRRNRKLITGITAQLILTVLLCVLIYFYTEHRATTAGPNRGMLNSAIIQATNQIKLLSSQTKALKDIEAQKNLLLSLRAQKYQFLMILQTINNSLPKTINLVRIVRKKGKLNLYGTATTNKQVTEFVNKLSESDIIKDPVLKEAKTLTQDDAISIRFQIDTDINPRHEILRDTDNAKSKK